MVRIHMIKTLPLVIVRNYSKPGNEKVDLRRDVSNLLRSVSH